MKKKQIAALLLSLLMLLSAAGCHAAAPAQTEASSQTDTAAQTEADASSQVEAEPDDSAESVPPPVELISPDGSFHESFTLMVYMTGSNLESDYGCATADLEEMTASGIDLSNVNLLVYTGGCTEWHSNDISADVHTVLHLTDHGFEALKTFPEQSMGEADSLTRYLTFACENYPADSYGLILWNHGNGPVMGYGSDLLHNSDSMKLAELADALKASPFGKDNKLAFLGFDACLMSSAELICTTAPYAEYLISSQETEPSFGWDYSFLEYCGQLPAADLAHNIVSCYMSYCNTYFESRPLSACDVTLSVVDLSCGEALQKALDALFEVAEADVSGDYTDLAASRIRARALGRASTGSEYDLVDLRSLMVQMKALYPQQAQAVLDILDSAVVTNGSNAAGCRGVSMFYPYYNKRYFESLWRDDYLALNAFPHYSEYLTRFSQVWLGTDMIDAFTDLSDPEAVTNTTFTLQLTEEQQKYFAAAAFYVLRRVSDEQYSIISYSHNITENNGLLTANFNGKTIYCSRAGYSPHIILAINKNSYDTVDEYLCAPLLSRGSMFDDDYVSQAADLVLSVDTATDEVTVKGLFEEDDDSLGSGKRPEIDLSAWDALTLYDLTGRYLTRDDSGRIVDYWQWPVGSWITGVEYSAKTNLTFSYEPIYDDGCEYFVMFDIMDVQGDRCCSELLPIRLAERPQEEASPATDLVWDEGSSLVLSETDEMTISLNYLYAPDTCTNSIFLSLENKTAEDNIDLQLSRLTADGSFQCSQSGDTIVYDILPGETVFTRLKGLDSYCTFAQVDMPSSLSFILDVASDSQVLMPSAAFSVKLGSGITVQSQSFPFLDACAEEQTLYQADGITVTLDRFGFLPDDSHRSSCLEYLSYFDLNGAVKIENDSDTVVEVEIPSLVANGLAIDLDQSMTVLPGTYAYLPFRLSASEFTKSGISSISEAGLCLSVIPAGQSTDTAADYAAVCHYCPITLTQAGTGTTPEPVGTLLYEDDTVQVYQLPHSEYDSSNFALVLVNKTEQSLCTAVGYISPEDPDKANCLSTVFIPPHTAMPGSYYLWDDVEQVSVFLQGYAGTGEYSSAEFSPELY